jgi:hypothetical protein
MGMLKKEAEEAKKWGINKATPFKTWLEITDY